MCVCVIACVSACDFLCMCARACVLFCLHVCVQTYTKRNSPRSSQIKRMCSMQRTSKLESNTDTIPVLQHYTYTPHVNMHIHIHLQISPIPRKNTHTYRADATTFVRGYPAPEASWLFLLEQSRAYCRASNEEPAAAAPSRGDPPLPRPPLFWFLSVPHDENFLEFQG